MYYSSFGILSLTIVILTNLEFFYKGSKNNLTPSKISYRYFLLSVILYFISDIVWGITYEQHYIAITYVDTILYFSSMALSVMLWTEFVVKFLNNKNTFNRILKLSGRIMLMFVISCLVINLFRPILFTFDVDGVYIPLAMRYFFLGLQSILFVVTAFYTFFVAAKSSGRERHRNLTVAVSGATMTAFIFFQALDPFLPFYAIGCLFASTLIHIFLAMEGERDRNRILADALENEERANAAKTIFLNSMSHEIRTPINTILGMNEIIRRECKDENIIPYADNIQEAGNRLLRTITDILDYTKIESGKIEILDEEYYMSALIGDLHNFICPQAREKGLKVSFEIDPEIPQKLYGDMHKIKRVITNLFSNAVKFTEKGSIIFRISVIDREEKHARLRFIVIDTGIGIKKEDKEKLFQAFNRLETNRNCSIEGAGMGLTLASNILQIMGTKLYVDSAYNTGSTFHFDIIQKIADSTPVGTSWNQETMNTCNSEKDENISFTSPESRILLVDDTELNLKVISGLLRPLEMQIDTASSGEEGIAKFGSNDYDVVFLDYLMPQMNGIETLAKIHEEFPEKAASTPIISLTASAVTGVKEQMLGAGFTDFMAKPVTLADMMKMLIKHLPKDKIHTEKDIETLDQSDNLNGIPKELYAIKWINVEEAIEFCGSPESYLEAIEIFSSGIDEKADLLENCVTTNDINLFTVTIHALKSSLKTLGVDGLANKAMELELFGKDNDLANIKENLPDFLKEYRGLKTILLDAIGKI